MMNSKEFIISFTHLPFCLSQEKGGARWSPKWIIGSGSNSLSDSTGVWCATSQSSDTIHPLWNSLRANPVEPC